MSVETSKVANRYYEAWTGSLARVLSQISAAEWRVESTEAGDDCKPEVHVRLTSSHLAGGQWAAFSAADVGKLLHLFLSEEVTIAGQLDEMQKEALLELLRQWCGLAATALKPQFGELSFEVTLEEGAASDGRFVRFLRAGEGSDSILVRMEMDGALAASMQEPEEPSKPSPSVSARDVSSAQVETLLGQGNLELLMDVELPVMLRFGKRQTTLREVLELATGAVLELDREVQEPVELVLHEKVIARGEVVVVDGNYGLRVTEVASPQQRVVSI